MKELKATLIERIERITSVDSFRFRLQEKLEFTPGQFLQIFFDPQNRDNKSLNKYLSFSSSPNKEYIEVTKRLSGSDFSQRLKSLNVGNQVLVKAPLGNCVFKEEYKKIAFLIGGIGITPVISIIEHIAANKLNTDVVLLYSNKTEEEIAFKNELQEWQAQNKNIKVLFTVTEYLPKGPQCLAGRITKDLITEKIPDAKQRIFFIFGPPRMVEAMKALCLEAGCKEGNLKTESFLGY